MACPGRTAEARSEGGSGGSKCWVGWGSLLCFFGAPASRWGGSGISGIGGLMGVEEAAALWRAKAAGLGGGIGVMVGATEACGVAE